jgi:hypothetical protein
VSPLVKLQNGWVRTGSVFRVYSKDEEVDMWRTHLFHIVPMNPVWGFISLKLALRAAAAASTEPRFWLCRLANLRGCSWEPCVLVVLVSYSALEEMRE